MQVVPRAHTRGSPYIHPCHLKDGPELTRPNTALHCAAPYGILIRLPISHNILRIRTE